MSRAPRYGYTVARIRAEAGKRLSKDTYMALLGCKSLKQIVSVLRAKKLLAEEPKTLSELVEALAAKRMDEVKAALAEVKGAERDFIGSFVRVLEMLSAVSALRVFVSGSRLYIDCCAIPFGEVRWRDLMELMGGELSPLTKLGFLSEGRAAVEASKKLRCDAPLIRLATLALTECLEQCRRLSGEERIAAEGLAGLWLDALASLAAVHAFAQNLPREEFGAWMPLRTYRVRRETLIEAARTGSFDQVLRDLGKTPPSLEEGVEGFELFVLEACFERARAAVVGYPFRATCIAGFLALSWLDLRNTFLIASAVERGTEPGKVWKIVVLV